MEGSVSVISTGRDKVGQNIIAVGSTDKAVYGKAHDLCDISGKNVAEVTRGNANVYRFSFFNVACVDHIAVSRHVVNDLGNESAPVDGVCRREEVLIIVEQSGCFCVSEYLFNSVLRVVKVALLALLKIWHYR